MGRPALPSGPGRTADRRQRRGEPPLTKAISPGGTVNVQFKGKMAELIAGRISVEDMDNEELVRGQFKDAGGKFRGRPPRLIPREIHDRMRNELLLRGQQLFAESYLNAIRVYAEIAADPGVEPKARLRAAAMIIERIGGKTPERIELNVGDDKWTQALNKFVGVDWSDVEVQGDE